VFVPNFVSSAAGVALLAAAAFLRESGKHAVERRALARLPVGPDGIIPGAQPIDLPSRDPRGPVAVLIHGFGDTPQTLSYLAGRLHERGWAVRVPLLPGHGRTLSGWARTRATDWLVAARAELNAVRAAHDMVALIGLSMGGAIATVLASEVNATTTAPTLAPVIALVLISPYLGMPASLRVMADLFWVATPVLPYISGGGGHSILDPVERERSLAYGVVTPRLIHELATIMRRAWATLPEIKIPTLIVQSHLDNRVAPSVATAALARLTAADKRLVWNDRGAHVITVDRGRDEVATTVGDWIDAHLPAGARSRMACPA
jgi:carboxylesterase